MPEEGRTRAGGFDPDAKLGIAPFISTAFSVPVGSTREAMQFLRMAR
jgi:hypothetical protein